MASSALHIIDVRRDRGRLISCALALGLLIAAPMPAWAHSEASVTPETLWSAWNWQPSLLIGLPLLAGLYLRGVLRLWQRAGVGQGIRRWQVGAFGGGLLALFIALVSPLEALSGVLFWAHMTQHLTLILVAAPLLVLGAPVFALLWALPQRGRQAVGRWWKRSRTVRTLWHGLSHPLLVWGFYATTIWIWHAPSPYQAALRNSFVHELEHLNFLLASGLFCWTIVSPMGRRRLSRGLGVLFLFTTSLHGGMLGALITFSPSAWYSDYAHTAAEWGLSPLFDQQLAGLIMWVPMGMLYTTLAALLFARWLKDLEADMPQQAALLPVIPDPRPHELRD